MTMVAAKMVEERFALLIVDSITALFRVRLKTNPDRDPKKIKFSIS